MGYFWVKLVGNSSFLKHEFNPLFWLFQNWVQFWEENLVDDFGLSYDSLMMCS
jgi:hypothetical protein